MLFQLLISSLSSDIISLIYVWIKKCGSWSADLDIHIFKIGIKFEKCAQCTKSVRPRKIICVVQVTRPTLNFLPPTLNFLLQLLKLEENSRTK